MARPAAKAAPDAAQVQTQARPKAPAAAPSSSTPSTPLTVADRQRMAYRPPSFTELLPWTRFDKDTKLFELRHGEAIGMLFELTPVSTEARPLSALKDQAYRVQEALQAMPESDSTPWVVQFFVNDDSDISRYRQALEQYVLGAHVDPKRGQAVLQSDYTQAYLAEVSAHLQSVSAVQGLFTDTLVTGQPWRGQVRRVHAFIYRKFVRTKADLNAPKSEAEQAALTLMSTFNEAGIGVRRCNGRDFYEWMLPFFNRAVPWAPRASDLVAAVPYPGDEPPGGEDEAPMADWDLAEMLSINAPTSDLAAGCFEFDGVPVKALTLQNMRQQPSIGHFTAERKQGAEFFARFDRLPAGSMLSITVTIQRQDLAERHVTRIRDSSRAQSAVAQETHSECERVLRRLATGDKLYPMVMTLYLTAPSKEALNAQVQTVKAQLIPSGLNFIDHRNDLVPLDAFIRGLPGCFDPAFDAKELRRSRLTFASHIAALLPLYGRARGTGRPGFFFWNRGGEPLMVDPLNRRDRKKNAHMLVLGPTGAGKSATLNYLCMSMVAIYRPRLVICDAGKSFGLLVDFFKSLGLSTITVNLNSEAEVSLPPFVHAMRLLDDEDVMQAHRAMEGHASQGVEVIEGEPEALAPEVKEAFAKGAKTELESEGGEAEEKRDLLGEMVTSAIMMVTGGEHKEIERFTRADRYLVTLAIVRAALLARNERRSHVVTHDVALQLMRMAQDPKVSAARGARAEEMGQSMSAFTQGLRGKLFNRPGADWPDVDVTLVEMGTLTQDGYGDALALAYTSLIDSVQSRGERAQAEDRPLVFLTDEGHLISTNELLGPKIAKGTKMWRKLNIWFWLATQNMKDFPDSMSRVLSMCEFWLLLTMDRSEIEEVSRFRTLTPEQRMLLESAVKEPGKYTEGVILSSIGQMLFRNVPPALPIALAMTEGHEKAARRRLMHEHGVDELGAARLVAKSIAQKRD